jgi:invasion protein IalB
VPFRGLAAALILALIQGAVTVSGAAAQPAGAAKEMKFVASPWRLNCQPGSGGKDVVCQASQSVVVKGGKQAVLIAFVTPWRQEGASAPFLLRFRLPHGLDIPAGAALKVDDKPIGSARVQTSSPEGVFARAPLDDAMLAAMKAGKLMTVEVTALNGAKLTLPVSLNGFTAIFDKLQ